MKKARYFLGSSVIIIVIAVLGTSQTASAHAGLTPNNPFYFLDITSEALKEFFTFNPEGKARLQITFAQERIEEIKVILVAKGVDAKGLDVAQSRLESHLGTAAAIVSQEKTEGSIVTGLAEELNNNLEQSKASLIQTFKEQERTLEAREKELKAQLKAAHEAGDTAKEEALAQELGKVKAQLALLELKEEDIEDDIEDEEELLEEEMEAKVKAEKAIQEAERELAEIKSEATEEGVVVPASAFDEFNNLLSQAKSAFQAGNYLEAKRLAKQAEKSLEKIEETIEDLEEQQELKEEALEAIQEAEEELKEIRAEAQKEGITLPAGSLGSFSSLLSQAKNALAAGKYQEAKRLAEQAEDALENIENEIERLEEEKDQDEEEND